MGGGSPQTESSTNVEQGIAENKPIKVAIIGVGAHGLPSKKLAIPQTVETD
jgi:hypothetical protein